MFENPPTLLAPSPRHVPLLLKLRVYFGGAINQMGWFFLGIGIFLCSMLDLTGTWLSYVQFMGSLEESRGEVTGWNYTGIQENERELFAIQYRFKTIEGGEYWGESYTTTAAVEEGQAVMVEYRRSNPEVSRIKGMRANKAALWFSFFLLFPLVGGGLVLSGLRTARKANYLLSNGELATGILQSKEATSTRVNKRPVYKLTFAFTTPDGQSHQAIAKTHRVEMVEDEAEERLVYDPRNPSLATILDSLPTSPVIDSRGNFAFSGDIEKIKTLFYLLIPILAILLNTVDWQGFFFY